MITENHPVSAYLLRPLRSLRQTCIDAAHRHGLARPDCGDCTLEPVCEAQDRRARRPAKTRRRRGQPPNRI